MDWSASVLACIGFVKATLQPGRLRSSRFLSHSPTRMVPTSYRYGFWC